MRLVLGSASVVRGDILRGAGVRFIAEASSVDETPIKEQCRQQGRSVEETAMALAEAKAADVAATHPGALVIGADQILDCGGRWFDKPENADAARGTLLALRGKQHRLVNAVTVNRDGEFLWRHSETATLTMRDFSDAFLEQYLEGVGYDGGEDGGADILASVGAYRLEQSGAQLFSAIEGSYFTILGLPLLALLEFLRLQGVLVK